MRFPRMNESFMNRINMRTIVAWSALAAAGWVGNYQGYEVFFSVHFIFGSIFAMLVLQLFGLGPGVLATLVISSSTWLLWNHPYAIIILTAEALVVGVLTRRTNMGFVLADVVYWFCLGIPLVSLFYFQVMHLSFSSSSVMMMKQSVNGVVNAAVARLLFLGLNYWTRGGLISMKEMLITVLALFVLVPTIFLLSLQSRAELREAERSARLALRYAAERIPQAVDGWLQAHLNQISHLAWMAGTQPVPVMQRAIEQLARTESDFLRIGLVDETATAIAFSPLIDELGQKNLGKNFADRPFIPELKKTLKPMLSEVFLGRIGVPRPVAPEVAPVIRAGRYAGYVVGSLNLDSVAAVIGLYLQDVALPQARYVLLDRTGKVIASSRPEARPLVLFVREEGQIERIEEGIMQWMPRYAKNLSISEQWEKAFYFHESRIGGMAEWRLILEQPLRPFKQQMYSRYAANLSWVFAIFLAALATAELVSRMAVRSISDLRRVSSDLPNQISSGTAIRWPESAIAETEQLIYNFREMAQVIALQFHHIRKMNVELEQRVAERTRELRESEDRYRRLAENAKDIIYRYEMVPAPRCVFVNNAVTTITGYTPEEHYRDPALGAKIVHPDDRALLESVNAGSMGPIVLRWITKEGRTIWTEQHNVPILDSSGRLIALEGIARDITRRKEVEDALKQSEERFRTLFEKVKVVSLIIDPATGAIVNANTAAARYYGWPRERLLKMNISDINTRPVDAIRGEMNLAKSEQRSYFEFRHRRADGTVRDVEVYSGPVETQGGTLLYSIVHDVTERKHAEEALRRSEERLIRAQQVAKIGNWEWNIKTNELSWSDEVFRLYGVAPAVKPSYDIVVETLAPECRERFVSAVRDALQKGKHFEGEYTIIHPDGSRRHTHSVGEVARDASGAAVSMFGVVQDITERKEAESALRKSEERYRAIVENQVDFVDRYLPGGILTFVNEPLAHYVGMQPRDLIGHSFYSFLHDDDRASVISAIESLSPLKRSVVLENRVVLPDRSERWHQWTHSALFDMDGKVVEYQSVGRDVTERRQSEERLRQLANELRVILETIAVGVVYARNRNLVWANPAFEKIYGLDRGEYQGKDASILYADPADYERVGTEGYAQIAASGIYTTEARAVKKDGSPIWISLTGRAVNPGAAEEGSIWMFQDITDRKRAEKAVQERTHQLEDLTRGLEKVVEDEIAMRVRNEKLLIQHSKMAAMGEMLGAIAHQWRQPLNALGLIVQNLKDAYSYGELDREYLERTVQKSMAQIRHMSKTIDDFRNFFHPDKEKTVFDTMQAVGDVLALFSAQLAANDIVYRLTCHTHGRTFTNLADIEICPDKMVRGFRNEFEHVMLNLINNARDAILQNRGSGSTGQAAISFDFYNKDGMLAISVSDNGGGVDPGVMDRIFEPYFTTKDPAKGTGLGLYMSKVIIEDHMHGKLSVRNDGRGAVFTIELPWVGKEVPQ